MKAIIPVAGFGKRLRPHTLTNPKVMLNVGGKPIIHYLVEDLIKNNIADSIIFVVGYLGEKVQNYLDETFDFKFDYTVQYDAKGLGHAVLCAEKYFKNNEEALIILGDTIFDVNLSEFCNNSNSVIGTKTVKDPRRFGVVEKNNEGYINRFVEKPESKQVSPSDEAIVGLYYIKDSDKLFSSLKHNIDNNIKVKDEYQLTDALEKMIKDGEKMVTYNIDGWYDCGKPETLLSTNSYLLSKHGTEAGYEQKYKDSKINHPVHIGENVEITNSIIGPFVTINKGCTITNSIISNTIVNKDTKIENAFLTNSIIGESSYIKREQLNLNIGDFSEA